MFIWLWAGVDVPDPLVLGTATEDLEEGGVIALGGAAIHRPIEPIHHESVTQRHAIQALDLVVMCRAFMRHISSSQHNRYLDSFTKFEGVINHSQLLLSMTNQQSMADVSLR